MDIIYRSIVKRLQTEIPELRWIDLEGGQLEAPEESYPVQFPAVFIDFPSIQYQSLQRGAQQGIATIAIRVAFDIYEDFHGTAPDIETAANRLQLLNSIHKALHGYSGMALEVKNTEGEVTGYEDNYFSRMVRQSMTAEKRSDGLKVYEISFLTNLRDRVAMPQVTQTTLDDIIVEKQTNV
jgi:hypothetical protein